MYGHVLAGTPIAVDCWDSCAAEHASVFFVSHLHADITKRLMDSWYLPFYCSSDTKDLVVERFHIQADLMHTLELGTSHVIPLHPSGEVTMTVRLLDANHCPGSVMFLFQGYFGTFLYTAPFRFTPMMLFDVWPTIDRLYLDNTYCELGCEFGTREEATAEIIRLITAHQDCRVFIAVRGIGKEALLVHIASTLGTRVILAKKHGALMPYLRKQHGVITRSSEGYYITAIPLNINSITKKRVAAWNSVTPTIVIIPTAFYTSAKCRYNDIPQVFVVPYSDLSSYSELHQFVQHVVPRRIIPILRKQNRQDMLCFRTYLNRTVSRPFVIPESVQQWTKCRPRNVDPEKGLIFNGKPKSVECTPQAYIGSELLSDPTTATPCSSVLCTLPKRRNRGRPRKIRTYTLEKGRSKIGPRLKNKGIGNVRRKDSARVTTACTASFLPLVGTDVEITSSVDCAGATSVPPEVIKRKRGRPRKIGTEWKTSTSVDNICPPKKMRKRCSSRITREELEISSLLHLPSTTSVLSVVGTELKAAPVPSASTVVVLPEVGEEVATSSSVECADATSVLPEVIKRKRGRPRKMGTELKNSASVPKVSMNQIQPKRKKRRKRGHAPNWTRKKPSWMIWNTCTMTGLQTVPPVQGNSSDEDIHPKKKRKRGKCPQYWCKNNLKWKTLSAPTVHPSIAIGLQAAPPQQESSSNDVLHGTESQGSTSISNAGSVLWNVGTSSPIYPLLPVVGMELETASLPSDRTTSVLQIGAEVETLSSVECAGATIVLPERRKRGRPRKIGTELKNSASVPKVSRMIVHPKRKRKRGKAAPNWSRTKVQWKTLSTCTVTGLQTVPPVQGNSSDEVLHGTELNILASNAGTVLPDVKNKQVGRPRKIRKKWMTSAPGSMFGTDNVLPNMGKTMDWLKIRPPLKNRPQKAQTHTSLKVSKVEKSSPYYVHRKFTPVCFRAVRFIVEKESGKVEVKRMGRGWPRATELCRQTSMLWDTQVDMLKNNACFPKQKRNVGPNLQITVMEEGDGVVNEVTANAVGNSDLAEPGGDVAVCTCMATGGAGVCPSCDSDHVNTCNQSTVDRASDDFVIQISSVWSLVEEAHPVSCSPVLDNQPDFNEREEVRNLWLERDA